jgi:endonuclease YncB( thermonuclease family)
MRQKHYLSNTPLFVQLVLTGYKFERVVDGDTFVAGGRMIRVWGIDAPEKGDFAYKVSSWLLQSLVKDQILNCRLVDVDKYKRDVMQCKASDLDVASTMVKFGMAKDYRRYSGGYYTLEEDDAKKNKRGIWSDEYKKGISNRLLK